MGLRVLWPTGVVAKQGAHRSLMECMCVHLSKLFPRWPCGRASCFVLRLQRVERSFAVTGQDALEARA